MQFDPPNALGIADFGDRDILVLESMLDGADASSGSEDKDLQRAWDKIGNSTLLAPLFT